MVSGFVWVSELKAFQASALNAFQASALGARGARLPKLHEVAFTDTFQIFLELDGIEIHEVGGSKLVDVDLGTVSTVVFNQFLNMMVRKVFAGNVTAPQFGNVIQWMAELPAPTDFSVIRTDRPDGLGPGQNPGWRRGNTSNPESWTFTTGADRAILEFDTLATALRETWFPSDEASTNQRSLRGLVTRGVTFIGLPNPTGVYHFAVHWPASENPVLPVPALGWDIRVFGRCVFKAL